MTLPWIGTKLTLVGMNYAKEEITIYKGNICTPLNDECNDFIWGKFIDESVVVGLEEFWHNQNILNFHEGQVLRQGDVTVDKEYKDSLIFTSPINCLRLMCRIICLHYKMCSTHTWRGFLSVRPLVSNQRPLSMQWYPKGGGFKQWHTERSNALPGSVYRHLVFMTYLNDVPDGGTEWYYQQRYVPAQRGYTVIWQQIGHSTIVVECLTLRRR